LLSYYFAEIVKYPQGEAEATWDHCPKGWALSHSALQHFSNFGHAGRNMDLAERLGERVSGSLACSQASDLAVPVLCLLPPKQRKGVKEVARISIKLKI